MALSPYDGKTGFYRSSKPLCFTDIYSYARAVLPKAVSIPEEMIFDDIIDSYYRLSAWISPDEISCSFRKRT
jgi:hypothetical protein